MPFEPINWLAVYCIFVVSITSLKHIPIFLWLQIAILLLIFVDACWICDFVDDIDEFYSCWHIFWCFSHLKPLPFFRWLFSILIEFRIFIDDFDPPGKFIISCLNPDLFLWFSLPPQIFSILQPRGRRRRRQLPVPGRSFSPGGGDSDDAGAAGGGRLGGGACGRVDQRRAQLGFIGMVFSVKNGWLWTAADVRGFLCVRITFW